MPLSSSPSSVRRCLAGSLLALAAAPLAMAADGDLRVGVPGSGELGAGPRFSIGQQRVVVIRGLLDMDAVNRGQYLSGNRDVSDHAGYGNIRAELGTRVRLDENVAVNLTFAYDARAGDNTADDPTGTNRSGFTVVDDAFVEFRDFLGFDQFGATLGRQPVRWNLREGRGGFLYDSFANNPRVTSWDGARLAWNIYEGVDVLPFAYSVPGASTLMGGGINWKPARSGDSRVFLSYLFTWERRPPMRTVAAAGSGGSEDSTITLREGIAGDRLLTHDLQGEYQAGDLDFYAEAAFQQGNQTDTIDYLGYGGYAGIDWHVYAPQAVVLGIQLDHQSGNSDSPSKTGQQRALISNWEANSDTLIVEHERYGELSNLVTEDGSTPSAYRPGLQALKLRCGLAFDDHAKVRLNTTYAFYRTAQSIGPFAHRSFGHEADLTLTWDYTWNVTFKLFGGAFLPRAAYRDLAPVGRANAGDDLIYLFGGNLTIAF